MSLIDFLDVDFTIDHVIKYNKPIFECPRCGGRRFIIRTKKHPKGIQYDGVCNICGIFTSIILEKSDKMYDAYSKTAEELKTIPEEE